uniref:Myosin_tail_1 domain-containing protein n=1 Tax=Macrostomum lignano TaxID=282301 RepID=A0A1I8ISQ6_9PLAT
MEQVASLNASKDEAGRQLAEAKAKADSANAALAEAESRADKSEKSAALLAQELAAAGAAVREKDARLEDLRQELSGLREAMAHGSASMKSEFAAMLERLCEEKDKQLADREGELASLMEKARQGASTKLKTNIAAKATDIAAVEGDLVDTDAQSRRSQSPRRSPRSSPANKPTVAVSAATTPASASARTPKPSVTRRTGRLHAGAQAQRQVAKEHPAQAGPAVG